MPCTHSKQCRSCPAQATATMPDWSSLHLDLVRRIGDCLLAADDVDYYIDFRAVCPNWRSATDDPRAPDCADPGRFQPRKWALLGRHDDLTARNDGVTLVNVETGRFLVKDIPLLHRYFFVGATSGGLFLLGELADPHQARVLNPFTGSIARFKACIPIGGIRTVAVVTSPMMIFISGKVKGNIMWADQSSEHFREFWVCYPNEPLCMTSFAGSVYLTNRQGSILSTVVDVAAQGRSAQTISIAATIPSPDPSYHSYYLVESGGELLHVTRPWYSIPGQLVVHRVDTMRNVLEPVRSFGNRALFISDIRCLSVDADKFQTVQGGCIYFVDPVLTGPHDTEPSFVTTVVANGALFQELTLDLRTIRGCSRPFTLTQVFADYCKFIQYSELSQMFYSDGEFSYDSESDDESSESNEGSSEPDE